MNFIAKQEPDHKMTIYHVREFEVRWSKSNKQATKEFLSQGMT